jgi:uncharacterized protein YpiB (UPF0302 family)
MIPYFFVTENFTYCCSYATGENHPFFQFQRGDVLVFLGQTLINQERFCKLEVNHTHEVYMSVKEIDEKFLTSIFVSKEDIRKLTEQIRCYIDYALDIRSEEMFYHYSKQLIDITTILNRVR